MSIILRCILAWHFENKLFTATFAHGKYLHDRLQGAISPPAKID
jgi:hypothetical protein